MTTKKFINCTLQEIQRLCTLAQYSDVEPAKDGESVPCLNLRVVFEEIEDCATVLSNPSLTETVAEQTTNKYLAGYSIFHLDDNPNLIQTDKDGNPLTTAMSVATYHGELLNELYGDDDVCRKSPFVVNDIIGILRRQKRRGADMPTIRIIDGIWVTPDNRGQGIGTEMIKKRIGHFPDDLILAVGRVLKREYPEKLSDSEHADILEKQRPFFEKNGFEDINDYIGYSKSVAYLYTGNEIGQTVLKAIRLCCPQEVLDEIN